MFVHYISFRYLSILAEYGCDHIYRSDISISVIEEEEYIEIEEDFEFTEEESRERVCITETFGFDTLTAITQASINYHFRCLWKAAQSSKSCLSGWSLDKNFDASFGAPQIQLPCDSDGPVIVYFTLREGALAVLDYNRKCVGLVAHRISDVVNLIFCNRGKMHGFSGWRVAFEVKLRLREYGKAHAISDSYLRGRESVGDFVNYQLVLDFKSTSRLASTGLYLIFAH
jgi:hypothetical protein